MLCTAYILYTAGRVRLGCCSEHSLLTLTYAHAFSFTLIYSSFFSQFLSYHLCLTHTYSTHILCAFSVEVTWFVLSKLLAGDTHASPHTDTNVSCTAILVHTSLVEYLTLDFFEDSVIYIVFLCLK